MEQMGHTTPHLTLSLYARSMQRRDGERVALRALVDGDAAAEEMGDARVPPTYSQSTSSSSPGSPV
jgi:hypothetical protein